MNRLIERIESAGYKIKENGDITGKTGQIIKPDKFRTIKLYVNRRIVAIKLEKLIALKFLSNPKKHRFVHFIDEDKTNFNANNLKWKRFEQCFEKIKYKRIDVENNRERIFDQNELKGLGYNIKEVEKSCKGKISSYKEYIWEFIEN